MSRAERVESELVSLADWIERYFASRDLLPPPAIAAGVASARAALALPADAPAQPAPEGAGEAGDSDDGGNCRAHGAPVCEPCAFDRGYAAGLCKNAEAQPHPTPRAEAYVEWCARHDDIEKVPGPFCPACAYASVMRDGVKMGRESAPRAQPAPGHTDLMVTPESVGPYVAAEAVREACAKACDDLVARANEKVREWSMSDHGREAAAMVERYHASAYREAAAAIRSLPLPTAPASAEAVADSIIDAIVAETRAHLERMERLWGDLSRAASSPGGSA